MSGSSTTGGVEVYQAGAANLLGTFAVTTDANGRFSVELAGLAAGACDVSVKGASTLSNKSRASPSPRTLRSTAVLFWWATATYNSVDTVAGHINFSASRYNSPYLDSFTAATIRSRAKASVESTSLALY